VDASTQDYIQNCDVQTLTTTKYETAEIGIQTSFSKIKPEDIQEDASNTQDKIHLLVVMFFFYLVYQYLLDCIF
jgi:hypothetical protein